MKKNQGPGSQDVKSNISGLIVQRRALQGFAACPQAQAAQLKHQQGGEAALHSSQLFPKSTKFPFQLVLTGKKISPQLFEGLPASPSFYPFLMHSVHLLTIGLT